MSTQHTLGPIRVGKEITAQRVERDALFDNSEHIRANFTARDREVATELETTEMLREFIATEL